MSDPLNPLRKFNVGSKVTETLFEVVGRIDGNMDNESHLFDDFGVDSVDLAEIVLALEKDLKIEISEKEAGKWRTVGDVIDCVASKFPPLFVQADVDEIVAAAKAMGAGPGLHHKRGQFSLDNYAEPHGTEVLAQLIVGGWAEKWDLIHATAALINFLHKRNPKL